MTSVEDTASSSSSDASNGDGSYFLSFIDNLGNQIRSPKTSDVINLVGGVAGSEFKLGSEVIAGVDAELGEIGDKGVESIATTPGIALEGSEGGPAAAFGELGSALIGLAAGLTATETIGAGLAFVVVLPEIAAVGVTALFAGAVGYFYSKAVNAGIETINDMVEQAQSSNEPVTQTLSDGTVATVQPSGSYNFDSNGATYSFNNNNQFTGLSVQAQNGSALNGLVLNVDTTTGAITGTDPQGIPFSVQITPSGTDGITLINPSTGENECTIQPTGSGYVITAPSGEQTTIPIDGTQGLVTVQPTDNGDRITNTVNPSTGEQTSVLTGVNGDVLATTTIDNNGTGTTPADTYQTTTTLADGDVTASTSTSNADGSITSASTSYDSSGAVIGSERQSSISNSDGSTTLNTTDYDASGNITGTTSETVTANSDGGWQSVSYSYDAVGALLSQTNQTVDAVGNSSSTTTQADGSYTTSLDNLTDTVTDAYSSSGLLQSSETVGDLGGSDAGYSSTTRYTYNANGSVATTTTDTTNTDGSSSTTTDNGTDTITKDYDPAGNLEFTSTQGDPGGSDANHSSETGYLFNPDGSLYVGFTQVDDGVDTVETAYNSPGQVSFTQTSGDAGGPDAGNSVSYQYDYYADGAVSSIVQNSSVDGQRASGTYTSYTDSGVPIVSYDDTYSGDGGLPLTSTTIDYDSVGDIASESTNYFGPDGIQVIGSSSEILTYDDDDNVQSTTSISTEQNADGPATNTVDSEYYGTNPYSETQTYTGGTPTQDGTSITGGLLTSDVINSGGGASTTNYVYNSAGQLTEVRTTNLSPDGSTVSADSQYTNNSDGSQTVNTTVNIGDQSGNPTSTITSSLTFDAAGNQTSSSLTASTATSNSVAPGTYSGGGYAFAGGTTQSAGVNIGIIAQYDFADGDTAAGLAAMNANQQALAAENGSPSGSGASTLEGPKWGSSVITWSLASGPGSSGAFSSVISSSYVATIEAAFATWSAATGVTFEQVSNPASADIQLGWGNFNSQSTGVLGYTNYTEQKGEFSSANILLEDPNDAALVTAADGSLTYSGTNTTLQQVLLHEIGHALGLADDSDPNSIMYGSLDSNNTSLSSADIAAVQALYGGGAVTRPTTTFEQENSSGQLISSFTQNSDGSTAETTYNSGGQAASVAVTNTDGSTSDSTYQYNADGSYEESTVSTPAGGGASSTSVTDYTAQGLPINEQTTTANGSTVSASWVYNADGSYTFTLVQPSTGGGGNTTLIDKVNASGQVTSAQTLSANGASQTTDYNADAQVASTETVAANGATDLQTWAYSGASISSETDVSTPTPGGPSTTTVTDYNAQGQTVSQQTSNADGSSDAVSWAYHADGSYTLTLVETPSSGTDSTTIIDEVSATGQVTSLEIDNPSGSSAAAPESEKWTYNSDGSFTVTDMWANADSSEPITQVTAYSASDQLVSENTYSPSSNGSYTDSWSQADGSHGTYWWNSSTAEYLDTWNNADGSSFTDEYQYSSGGGPTVAGSSYTEAYSASDGDAGTRQYNAASNTTTVTWESSATGLITGTSTGDTGFVGLINSEELANSQNDPTYFNPALSPAFNNLLAAHG